MSKNKVFIATSIDNFIADKNGNIDWLHSIPNPDQDDMGYQQFMNGVDALLMGRNTFDTVSGFDIEWPYEKPVFVLSNSLKQIPDELSGKVELLKGGLNSVLNTIHNKGYSNLYIDGGKLIQSFLKEDLIDEMTITKIPILLGEGVSLFSSLEHSLNFECINTKIYLNSIVQNQFKRVRK
ncbi:dihydrofolate reductase family protein [Marivirga arenosa]|uniref:Dihydrofolate reductase family protein n=1 Tax=Marivirga arenosa TaxID=3059076 RepID=A0AA52F012_9BACT|nr:dihydrofolate reductase family protein [Marivirga sp. BKB1-2]WNB17918.1 dihydrofolate reductase family protein [Marivirga sp. BKB1-2]